jgi:HSP20 family protein
MESNPMQTKWRRTMAEILPVKKTKTLFEELNAIQDRVMRRAFDIFNGNGHILGKDLENWLQAERELVWKPSIDIEEKENEFLVRMAVPGVEPKDIDIEVTPDHILVKAEIKHEHDEKKGRVHVCEFSSGNMFRAIQLPKRIDPDKVKAEFKNGMLNVKAEIAEVARTKKVPIEAARTA